MRKSIEKSTARRSDKISMLGAVVVVAAAVVCIRILFAYTFPIPWSDETDFIAQAFELSRNGTFFVYGLNPDRIVMWMPPGYMLLLAAVFTVFGYSFDVARWISSVLFILAYAASSIIVLRCLQGRLLKIALVASLLAFLSPYSLAIANIARMEAFYTLLILVALMCVIVWRTPWIGASVVLTATLIHFNTVYFAVPFFIYFLSECSKRSCSIRRIDVFFLLFSLALLVVYLIYAAMNWQGFVEDMTYQFDFKALGPRFFGLKGGALIVGVYLLALSQWLVQKRFSDSVFIALFGAGFVAMYLYGKNMWYTYATCIGFFLLFVSSLITAGEKADIKQAWAPALLSASYLAALVYFSFIRITPQFEPLWLRPTLFGRQFVSEEDREKIGRFIETLPPKTTICFGHSGIEPFFFQQLADGEVVWQHAKYSVTQPYPPRRSDYRVLCNSALLPKYLALFEEDEFARKSEDLGCDIISLTR